MQPAEMTTYRCYLFNGLNRVERVMEFTASSDAEACEQADRLHAEAGCRHLELWRDNRKVYCPGLEKVRA